MEFEALSKQDLRFFS